MTRKFLGEYRIFTQEIFTILVKTLKLEVARGLHFSSPGDASRGSL